MDHLLLSCAGPALEGLQRARDVAQAASGITAALRVLGLSDDNRFQNYHRALSRAHWSAHYAAGILLRLLIKAFVPVGPVLIGLVDAVAGDPFTEQLIGPSSGAWGRDPGEAHGKIAYFLIDGGTASPPPDGPQSATLVGVEFPSAAK